MNIKVRTVKYSSVDLTIHESAAAAHKVWLNGPFRAQIQSTFFAHQGLAVRCDNSVPFASDSKSRTRTRKARLRCHRTIQYFFPPLNT